MAGVLYVVIQYDPRFFSEYVIETSFHPSLPILQSFDGSFIAYDIRAGIVTAAVFEQIGGAEVTCSVSTRLQ